MMVRKRDLEMRDFDDFDDLVIVVVEMQNLREGYTKLGLQVPEWLDAKLRDGKRELEARTRAHKERKLANLKIRRESLLTADEKRSRVDAEIAALEAELA